MAEDDRPGYSFGTGAPADVATYFNNRGLRPTFSWQDVEPEEHAIAFTVAKAMDLDVLEEIHGSLQQAIEDGIPYRQWSQGLRPRLQDLGWWGRQMMEDPLTGEIREVQLGSPRRLRTIYRANLRSARAAGQWARIQRTIRALPYLVYLLGPSERHRPHHEAKAGLVLPADDPFWETWFPPNGWGCKCHVRQISRREAEQRGISERPAIARREVVNGRTGEVRQVPVGIDPGWEGNPGLARQRGMEQFLADRLDAVDPEVARVAARDMATSWRARRILEGSATGRVPVAMLPGHLAERLGTTTRVVHFSDATAVKQAGRRVLAPEDYSVIADAIAVGEVGIERVANGAHRLTFESLGDPPWRVTVKRTVAGDEIFVVSVHRSDPERWLRRKQSGRLEMWREW